jgi:SAM-dependent methyltransferase
MVQVMDYDAGGYDYRTFWQGRDFEHWAESRALAALLGRRGPVDWFVDLGGGFGRNLPVYRRFARNVVLVDYSLTNLRNAARSLRDQDAARCGDAIGNGTGDGVRVMLVRADVYRLPFVDRAFDGAASVRLLHHLTDLDAALAEMGRVVDGDWLIDVPIRHHLLAQLRGLRRARRGTDRYAPLMLGSEQQPYWNFHLLSVRRRLAELGWRTELGASVNNLRGWERLAGSPALRGALGLLLRPPELALQRVGRGWWGPSQFVQARRADGRAVARRMACATGGTARPGTCDGATDLLRLLACPGCHGRLELVADAADSAAVRCVRCVAGYGRDGGIWDFTAAARPNPGDPGSDQPQAAPPAAGARSRRSAVQRSGSCCTQGGSGPAAGEIDRVPRVSPRLTID